MKIKKLIEIGLSNKDFISLYKNKKSNKSLAKELGISRSCLNTTAMKLNCYEFRRPNTLQKLNVSEIEFAKVYNNLSSINEVSKHFNIHFSTCQKIAYSLKLYTYNKSDEIYSHITDYSDEYFIKICQESISMKSACDNLNLPFSTFKRYAEKLKCYKTNQSGKGVKKNYSKYRIPLSEIIKDNIHPQYRSGALRVRLIEDGYKDNKCEKCGNTEWNGLPMPLELEHIDGNKFNHHIDNLKILCPNCHTQTDTYKGKNIGRYKK